VLRLSGPKMALQTAVNKFFCAVGHLWRVVTASAYRQARQKVPPAVFVHLQAVACAEYSTRDGADHEGERWQGQRVGGVEGSSLHLPATEETRRRCSGQTKHYAGGEPVTGGRPPPLHGS
jgi:hypothetical protein